MISTPLATNLSWPGQFLFAVDRPDVQFACRELSAAMAKPNNRDWEGLKGLGRYRKGGPRMTHNYPKLPEARDMITFIDPNLAIFLTTRERIPGGCVPLGSHWLK